MSALEKFKRRLVRDIARRLYAEGQPEEEMWEQLKTEYGCDCFLLWQHMKVLTSKKLKRMLAAEDRMECITRVARMTSTDWLTFDLVLVHQDVDVIGEDMIQGGKPESPVLRYLFQLVINYDVENISQENLVANWAALTHYYNTGGRACSSMLLQRRWYQLKDLTRRRFYDFWTSYRGNARNLEKSVKPTKLQFLIADAYPNIITQRFTQWKDLIEAGKVVQTCQFESRRRRIESNLVNTEDDPDLVVIEPQVETIEVAADSDHDEEQVADKKTDKQSKDNKQLTQSDVTIKVEDNAITLIDDDSDKLEDQNLYTNKSNPKITIKLEPTGDKQIPDIDKMEEDTVDKFSETEPKNTLNDDEKIKIDNTEVIISEEQTAASNSIEDTETELVLPKITCVMGNVKMIESQNKTETNQENIEEIADVKPEEIKAAKNTKSAGSVVEDVKEKLKVSFDTDVMDLNELPPTLEFVDDGIEFMDIDEDFMEPSTDNDDKAKSLQEVESTCKIDKKLVMFPITYTKKLDDMDIFKETDYLMVKGNDIIECAEAESRPKLNPEMTGADKDDEAGCDEIESLETGRDEVEGHDARRDEFEGHDARRDEFEGHDARRDEFEGHEVARVEVEVHEAGRVEVEVHEAGRDELEGQETGCDEVEGHEAGNDEIEEENEVPRVKYTSWLLQKPKHRNYNPILLCKNPDFNTRLKRLNAGFFLCERNRRLFNACKPVTIDIHKAFETKLVDNVLYLENTTIPNIKQEKDNDACVNMATVIPSAVPVQSLLDKTKEDDKDLLTQKMEVEVPKIVPNVKVIERGEVINKPIVPVCRAKENLLTVEVSAISSKNKLSDNIPPVQLVETTKNTPQTSILIPSSTKKNKYNSMESELAKKRWNKNVPPWMCRPVTAVPQWSNLSCPPVVDDECLITKDTLDKVLALLDSGVFPRTKKKAVYTISDFAKMENKNKEVVSTENIKNSEESVNLTVDNATAITNKPCPNPRDTVKSTTITNPLKRKKREKNPRTISKTSSFCCWARHKIAMCKATIEQDVCLKRYRHLCPVGENACFCCCREELMTCVEASEETRMVDHTYTIDGNPQRTLKTRRDVSIQARCNEECGQTEIQSTVECFPPQYATLPVDDKQNAIDSVPGKKNTNASLQFPCATNTVTTSFIPSSEQSERSSKSDDDGLQIDTDSNDEAISTGNQHPSSNTPSLICEENTPIFVPTKGPTAKTNIVSARPYWRLLSETKREATVPPQAASLKTTNNTEAIIETISLLDDEIGNPAEVSPQQAPATLLPKGVNLILLPDNTLSVSIERGVIIDPTSLSQLPDILAAVQKKLLESGLIKFPPKKNIINTLNENKVINIETENTALNDPLVINSSPELNVDNENTENNLMNIEIENIQENVTNPTLIVHQEDAVLDVINPVVNVTQGDAVFGVINPTVNVTQGDAVFGVINPTVNVTQGDAVFGVKNPTVNVTQGDAVFGVINPTVNVTQGDAVIGVINPTVNVTQGDAVIGIIDNTVNVTHENAELIPINPNQNVTEENAEVNVLNTKLNLTQDNDELNDTNSNLGQIVANSNSLIRVSSGIRNDNREGKIMYKDYVVKVAPETQRKTILSDLMTMSGISPEDANTPVEGTSHDSSDTLSADYTQNVAENGQSIPEMKKVKKVMVFIKKKTDSQQNNVIDLTEDNEKPEDDGKQNKLPINKQPPHMVYRKPMNIKRPKLIRIPASAVPMKIYKAAQSLLKKDTPSNESIDDIDKQMKIQIAKRYRQLNRKPTILDILRNLKASKNMTVLKKVPSESDSSDDEPLAKKSRRMHNGNVDSNDSVNVVPVSQYNVPVEYKGTTNIEEQNVTTTTEEYSILGI